MTNAPGGSPDAGGGESTDRRAAPMVDLLVVCTGNAARSVMAGYMVEYLAEDAGLNLRVTTAGTHTLDGQPMSLRTRAALATIPELSDAPVGSHRSRQVKDADFATADIVVAMETDHVRYVRRLHPEAAARTATLRRLCRSLPPGPTALAARVASLALDEAVLAPTEDVADPAGGETDVYVTCAGELWALCRELVDRLS